MRVIDVLAVRRAVLRVEPQPLACTPNPSNHVIVASESNASINQYVKIINGPEVPKPQTGHSHSSGKLQEHQNVYSHIPASAVLIKHGNLAAYERSSTMRSNAVLWTAESQQSEDSLVTYALDRDEAVALRNLSHECVQQYGSAENQRLHADAPVIAAELPRALRAAANNARCSDRLHAFVVSNVVINPELESTPTHWAKAQTDGSSSESVALVLIASLLGDTIGWQTQQDGRLVTDVLPIKGLEDSLVSSSSLTELGWHTEDAFSPYRADYVGLLCLRRPSRVATTVSGVDPSRIPSDIREILHEQRFIIRPDSSHTRQFNVSHYRDSSFGQLQNIYQEPPRVAILSGPADCPVLRIDRDFTEAQPGDVVAEMALEWIIDHLDCRLYDLPLDPGEAVFLNNNNVVHGRRPFQPRFDGTDRWLKRVNIVTDLRRTRNGRLDNVSRVITHTAN
ncbi:guanitoxin biosynthesis L-enduracididine beta-hydroxylase GntD [Mycobacterium szulgai]|uniref:Cyclic nucleotide-binding domain-containing protein n=1 Tax=Mycobacterium szulgai TaxID=1787 RepID=A0A1X2DI69_MYCSZ|nr:guanitoxin biosynthesis L-enduracididine beta-hydroxylase GntD [Mycobacterium szulgai]MCV7075333.1 TauD/TfdA family dioxygenase [Mycobacterium szulgai]ORW87811.1 hypothetical protein AWC27_15745 [Mycobacterium szulgai]